MLLVSGREDAAHHEEQGSPMGTAFRGIAFLAFVGLAAIIGVNVYNAGVRDRKSTRLNSSHIQKSRMPSSA